MQKFIYKSPSGQTFVFRWTDKIRVLRYLGGLAADKHSGFTFADALRVSEHIRSLPELNPWRNRVASYFFFGEDTPCNQTKN